MSEERVERVERVPSEVLQAFLMDEIASRLGDLQNTMVKMLNKIGEAEQRLEENTKKIEENTQKIEGAMAKLERLLRETIPAGAVESITLTVGDKIQQVKPETPWVSFSIYNRPESQSKVYVMVNKKGADRHPVEPDDTYEVDLKVPKIRAIYLVCDAGGSAVVDISAVR